MLVNQEARHGKNDYSRDENVEMDMWQTKIDRIRNVQFCEHSG